MAFPGNAGAKEAHRERAAKALQLRKAGLEWDDVAKQTGYSNRSGAWKAVMGLLARAEEPAPEFRRLLLARLDELLLAVWTRAIGGDLQAVDRAVNIIGRQARLSGLEAADLSQVVQQQLTQVFVAYGSGANWREEALNGETNGTDTSIAAAHLQLEAGANGDRNRGGGPGTDAAGSDADQAG